MKPTPKKRVATMKLEKIVATKFNKPKTIQSKKVSNLEDSYPMLKKDVVKKTMLSNMKKKMK